MDKDMEDQIPTGHNPLNRDPEDLGDMPADEAEPATEPDESPDPGFGDDSLFGEGNLGAIVVGALKDPQVIQAVLPILDRVVEAAVQRHVQSLTKILPDIVSHHVDQQMARYVQTVPTPAYEQPNPAGLDDPARAAGQGNGQGKIPPHVEQLLMRFLMGKIDQETGMSQPQNGPFDVVAGQITGLARIAEAIDSIRSPRPISTHIPGTDPNLSMGAITSAQALAWMQQGYRMAKDGTAMPLYPHQNVSVPPSQLG